MSFNWSNEGVWQGWTALHGRFASDPAMVSPPQAMGILNVFAIDPLGHLLWNRHLGAAWTGWDDVDKTGPAFAGNPSAVHVGDSVNVVARATDGTIRLNWSLDGVWQGWVNVGGRFTSDPVIVATPPAWGSVAEFAIDPNGRIQENQHAGASWSGWQNVDNSPGFVGVPSVVRAGDSLVLVARDSSGAVWFDYAVDKKWQGWASLDGQLGSDPVVVVPPTQAGIVNVFGLDKAGHLVCDEHFGAAWEGWSAIHPELTFVGQPAVAASTAVMTVAVRDTQGTLHSLTGLNSSWAVTEIN
jgi:hypothetical protein